MLDITRLPFPKLKVKNNEFVEYTLPEKLFLEQWIIPAGTKILLKNSTNFGYVILPRELPNIPKRIFKY